MLLNLKVKLRSKSFKQNLHWAVSALLGFLFLLTQLENLTRPQSPAGAFSHFWRRLQLSAHTRHRETFVISENLISLHYTQTRQTKAALLASAYTWEMRHGNSNSPPHTAEAACHMEQWQDAGPGSCLSVVRLIWGCSSHPHCSVHSVSRVFSPSF